MCLAVLLLFVTFPGRSLGYSPANTAAIAGQPVTMSCGVQTGNSLILWKFQPVRSQKVNLLFNGYNISKVRSTHFISGSKAGEFNLTNSDPRLEDAGTYQCIKTIPNTRSYRNEINIAELSVLLSVPKCGSNASIQGIVEGDHVLMWCSVDYLGNLDPEMEWSRDDQSIADSNVIYTIASDPFTLTATASEMMTSNDQNVTYSCKIYFKSPAMVQEKTDTFTAGNAPDYRDECNLTISIFYGSRNLSITPRKTTYTKGDRLHCSASGNPPPTYSWKDVDTGHVVDGPSLLVDDTMELRRACTYRCSAENIIAGEKKTTSETITFNVKVTILESSPGRSLIAIVGAGAAVGGIAVTVLAFILWRLTKRKCYIQPKENESAERQGSPHDYESVNLEDRDSTHQTADIEMDQSSIMANQTIDESMAETEETLAVAETLSHYDTLDGSQTVQESRPYSTLEAPNPEDQMNQEKEISGKSHDYYNVDMSSVVSEQDIHSN